jgi:DNA-binding transcriptional regulator YdaS (Cro superfamily)
MEAKTSPKEVVKAVIKHLDGPVKAAQILGVPGGRYQTVQQWALNGVPAEWCPVIERVTRRKFRCEELRPDVEWEVVRNRKLNVRGRAPEERAESATADAQE